MKWAATLFGLVAALLAWAYWTGWGEPAVSQPIRFPHKTHVQELKLECTGCHQRAESGAPAGRPPTALCVACHQAAKETPETRKILAYGDKGEEIPWKRVWRLPSHVFFPHRVHVTLAKIRCQTCHGPMETLDRPPERPLKALRMADCVACHEERAGRAEGGTARETEHVKAVAGRPLNTDCNTCHR